MLIVLINHNKLSHEIRFDDVGVGYTVVMKKADQVYDHVVGELFYFRSIIA